MCEIDFSANLRHLKKNYGSVIDQVSDLIIVGFLTRKICFENKFDNETYFKWLEKNWVEMQNQCILMRSPNFVESKIFDEDQTWDRVGDLAVNFFANQANF